MQQRLIGILIFCFVLLVADLYAWVGVRRLLSKWKAKNRRRLAWAWWVLSAYLFGMGTMFFLVGTEHFAQWLVIASSALFFVILVPKLVMACFVLVDDVRRIGIWSFRRVKREPLPGNPIPRSEFLMKAGLATAAVPFATLSWGVLGGGYDYKVHRVRVPIAGLPKAFDGLRILQLSDIHSGSLLNKTAVRGGIEMALAERCDLAIFSGDLVNRMSSEMDDLLPIIKKFQAPMGTYSVLGNHDYGDYNDWPSEAAKERDRADLRAIHKEMGWHLMMNEHVPLEVDGERIALIGIENWGTGRFPKYGDLKKAYAGTEDYPTRLLISHDPSHWDAQVRPEFPNIDLMMAGHTHGMQFGVEFAGIRWSPAQYRYKQWAGLYTEGTQQLYVNRGFGFIGFPGRVGILPEIAVLELIRA